MTRALSWPVLFNLITYMLLLLLPLSSLMQFHAPSTTHIATVLSKDEHTILCARAAASPLFVMPLSKKPGSFQTLLLQWQPPHRLLFTTLEEFKQWGPQAPPHLTVQLFDDLKESHGLVLARGDLINPQLISAPEVCLCHKPVKAGTGRRCIVCIM